MLDRIREPVDNIIVDQPIAYKGRASVMSDNMLKLMKDAKGVHIPSKGNPESEFIFLHFTDARINARIWISDKFTALPFSCGAKVEREFTCGVRFQDLIELLSVNNTYNEIVGKGYKAYHVKRKCPAERVDFTFDPSTYILTVESGNWKSNLNALETQFQGEPARMERTYTKEEQTEMKWLKKAVAKIDNRPILRFANVQECGALRCAVAADSYRVHVTMNSVENMSLGLLDVNKVGRGQDDGFKYPDLTETFESANEDKLTVNRTEFIAAVKTALANTDKSDKHSSIALSFTNNQLTVTGFSYERGIIETTIDSSGIQSARSFNMNGRFILDALDGSKGIPNKNDVNAPNVIMLSFSPDSRIVRFVVAPNRGAWIIALEHKSETPDNTSTH